MSEKKRRASDTSSERDGPPLKKYSSGNTTVTSKMETARSAADEFTTICSVNINGVVHPIDVNEPETLEPLQKQALVRAMREYKCDSERLGKRVRQLEDHQRNYDRHLSAVNVWWSKVADGVRAALAELEEDGSLTSELPPRGEEVSGSSDFLGRLTDLQREHLTPERVDEALRDRCAYTLDGVKRMREVVTACIKGRAAFVCLLNDELKDHSIRQEKLGSRLASEVDGLTKTAEWQADEIGRLREENGRLSLDVKVLGDSKQELVNRVAELEEQLDVTKEELRKSERARDKVARQSNSESASSPKLVNGSSSEEIQAAYQRRDQQRSREIEDHIKARVKAEQEAVHLKHRLEQAEWQVKSTTPSEQQVAASPVYVELYLVYQQMVKAAEETRRTSEESLNRERQKFREIETAHRKQTSMMLDEFRRLEREIIELRAERDGMQSERDAVQATRNYEFEQMTLLRKLENERKTTIKQLVEQIRRLKFKIYCDANDKELAEHYKVAPNELGSMTLEDINQSLDLRPLQTRLNAATERCEQLNAELDDCRRKLEAYQKTAKGTDMDLVDREVALRKQIEELRKENDALKQRLAEYDVVYGIKDPSDDELHIMARKLKEKQEENQELKQRVETHVQMEKLLMAEIESYGSRILEIDNKNNGVVKSVIDHEDRLLRLQQAKSEVESQLLAVNKQNDALKKSAMLLKQAKDKQDKTFRQMQYELENLKKQLELRDTEVSLLKNRLEKAATDYIRSQGEIEKLRATVERLNASHAKLSEVFSEKISKARADGRKAGMQEQKALDDSLTNGAPSSREEQLYRSQLKCSICKSRWKDRVIIKCGHVFCEVCLKNQVASRNRKCAGCGEQFSQSDIQKCFLV